MLVLRIVIAVFRSLGYFVAKSVKTLKWYVQKLLHDIPFVVHFDHFVYQKWDEIPDKVFPGSERFPKSVGVSSPIAISWKKAKKLIHDAGYQLCCFGRHQSHSGHPRGRGSSFKKFCKFLRCNIGSHIIFFFRSVFPWIALKNWIPIVTYFVPLSMALFLS